MYIVVSSRSVFGCLCVNVCVGCRLAGRCSVVCGRVPTSMRAREYMHIAYASATTIIISLCVMHMHIANVIVRKSVFHY